MSLHIARTNIFTPSQLTAYHSSRPIFVYGSLILPSLLAGVISRPRPCSDSDSDRVIASQMTPAVLQDYIRLPVRHVHYPAVIPCQRLSQGQSSIGDGDGGKGKGKVEGFLVFGLTPREKLRIDRYEAGLYTLEEVCVEVEVLREEGETKAERERELKEREGGNGIGGDVEGEITPTPTTLSAQTILDSKQKTERAVTETVQVHAEVYVWAGKTHDLVLDQEWSFDKFLESTMATVWI